MGNGHPATPCVTASSQSGWGDTAPPAPSPSMVGLHLAAGQRCPNWPVPHPFPRQESFHGARDVRRQGSVVPCSSPGSTSTPLDVPRTQLGYWVGLQLYCLLPAQVSQPDQRLMCDQRNLGVAGRGTSQRSGCMSSQG